MTFRRNDTRLEIDVAAFRSNYKKVKQFVHPAKVAAVVKANAYGHGVNELAKELQKLNTPYLCVSFVREGVALRNNGINLPILVLNKTGSEEIEEALSRDLDLSVDDRETAAEVGSAAEKLDTIANVHVFIDTGMHRSGVEYTVGQSYVKYVKSLSHVKVKGIYTHFAVSDWADLSFTYDQVSKFNNILESLPEEIHLTHAANSGAILQVKESYYTMVRPGLLLYGHYPSEDCKKSLDLLPVMSFKSSVSSIKQYQKGSKFGYSLTYELQQESHIASIYIGYADGVRLDLSNKGFVLIKGKRYPVVGRISMDIILVDIGNNSGIRDGDEVVLFGRQGEEEISIVEWCTLLNTIPYEVLCGISERVPRKYINN